MFNILSMELYKLKHQKSFKIMIVAFTLISIFFNINLNLQGKSISGKSGFAEATWDNGLMLLFCAILAGLFIGSDFVNKTINMQISSGHTRLNVLLGKSLAYFMASSIVIVIYPIVSGVIDTIYMGWGETLTVNSIIYIARVLILSIILNIGTSSFFVFFAFLLKDTGKTIAVSFLFVVLASMILTMLGTKFEFFKVILEYSTFNQAKFIMLDNISFSQTIKAFMSSVLQISLVLFSTYYIFIKSELN